MATGTFILRPSADVSVADYRPTTLSAAYLAINEETADDDSTYLYNQQDTATYTFELAGSTPNGKIKITDIKVFCRYYIDETLQTSGGVNDGTVKVNVIFGDIDLQAISVAGNSEDTSIDAVWLTSESSGFDSENTLKDAINSWISENESFPTLQLYVETYAEYKEGENKPSTNAVTYVTQVYLELTYEEITGLNIHRKVNGAWVQAQSAYQKQNGAWVEITEDECKEILQSSLVKKGDSA